MAKTKKYPCSECGLNISDKAPHICNATRKARHTASDDPTKCEQQQECPRCGEARGQGELAMVADGVVHVECMFSDEEIA